MDLLGGFSISELVKLKLLDFDISFTNVSLFLVIGAIAAIIPFALYSDNLVPNRLDAFCEIVFNLINSIALSTLSPIYIAKNIAFISSIFLLIASCNIVGLCPLFTSSMGYFAVSFTIAVIAFLYVTFAGARKHGLELWKKFVPRGVQPWIAPFLFCIELLSYCIRPFSLAIRLSANVFAGHILVALFGSFPISIWLLKSIPVATTTGLFFVELFMSVLQAYIFTMLLCIYLNDILHSPH